MNYDQEIEKRGHPENFEQSCDCEEEHEDVNEKTGVIGRCHRDRCAGCSLCEPVEPSNE